MKAWVAAGVLVALWSGQSSARSNEPVSDTDLSKDIENPVTRRITLPLRYEADFHDGAYKTTKDRFQIDQAVVPFRLNEDWALITRTKLFGKALPPKKLGEHWSGGLSNGYPTFFHSLHLSFVCPRRSHDRRIGIGALVLILISPSATLFAAIFGCRRSHSIRSWRRFRHRPTDLDCAASQRSLRHLWPPVPIGH